MDAATFTPTASSVWDPLKPLMGMLATFFLAFVGMLTFGMIGSLAYPQAGMGAIFGALIGFTFFFILGFLMTGAYNQFLPKYQQKYGLLGLLPSWLVAWWPSVEHGNFTLILTVHEVKNVSVRGLAPWSWADLYVEIECGVNPVKRTCVKADGKFNEQFRLQIQALDDSIMLRLKDQDVFGSTDIGYVCVSISHHIINNDHGRDPFPMKKKFDIESFEHDRLKHKDARTKASLILSFDHLDDYWAGRGRGPARGPEDVEAAFDITKDNNWNKDQYGAINNLSMVTFNTHAKLPAKRSDPDHQT